MIQTSALGMNSSTVPNRDVKKDSIHRQLFHPNDVFQGSELSTPGKDKNVFFLEGRQHQWAESHSLSKCKSLVVSRFNLLIGISKG